MNPDTSFENRFERAATYVQEARKIGETVAASHKQLREAVSDLEQKLEKISSALGWDEQLPEVEKTLRLIESARRGINQASIESMIGIHLGKALQEAWSKLP